MPGARHAGIFQRALQGFRLPVVAINHSDIVQGQAVDVPFTDATSDVAGFVVEVIEPAELRRGTAGASNFWSNEGYMVVIRVLSLQEVLSEVVGKTEYLSGVAVVESEDGGTATGLNACAG